jgi:hypothetical protein
MSSGDIILDTRTGLKWARSITCPLTYAAATTTCTSWGGRLPTSPELHNLRTAVIPCLASGMLDWDGPPPGQAVWSSTPDPTSPGFYELVYFDGTPDIGSPPADGHWVRCVM